MAQAPGGTGAGDARGGDPAGYPAGWEADVVLSDGSTLRVRPIRPVDADELQAFHVGQSERSTYLRFFAALPRLPERDLEHLVTVDHRDRVALVAVAGSDDDERIVGVARYDRVDDESAEVAFNVADPLQGRGIASVLLEHLAAAARERGVRRFVAQVLPQNGRMLGVFTDAGYEVSTHTADGLVGVTFAIDPTERSRQVVADREHRAEARSVRALLESRDVLVVGPVRAPARDLHVRLVRRVLDNLAAGVATGDVRVQTVGDVGGPVPGAPARDRLADVSPPVSLAVVAAAADDVVAAVPELARLGVRGLVLLSAGFAEEGPAGVALQRHLLRAVHGAGMRLIGPASFGLVATTGDGRLDASLAERPVPAGRVGLLCQSAPFAVGLLDAARRRGIGVSQFVSSGHRADVSGNDLMQFWAQDDATAAVGLHLESIGNPRKFARVARRLAAVKPVVTMTADRGPVVPPGHAVRPTSAPASVLAAVLHQSGVIRVTSTHQLMDVLELVTSQPLPAGPRTAVLATSASVAALVAQVAAGHGLVVAGPPTLLPEDLPADDVRSAVDALYADPDVDCVVAVRVPLVSGPDTVTPGEVARAAAATGRTTVAVMTGLHGLTTELTARDAAGEPRTVPAYATPADAVLALGLVNGYARWRAADRGRAVSPTGLDPASARELVDRWLPPGGGPVELPPEVVGALLAAVGVACGSDGPRAGRAGGPRPAPAHLVVGSAEDPLFGPVVGVGPAADGDHLLDDLAFAVPPLTDVEVTELVRASRTARLVPSAGAAAALEDLVARVSVLADEVPELAWLRLEVAADDEGCVVVGAVARLAGADRADATRRLART
jgi:acyl-CoA synthetase (NDP forming)/GNAT superfamily N-acetyltransferase